MKPNNFENLNCEMSDSFGMSYKEAEEINNALLKRAAKVIGISLKDIKQRLMGMAPKEFMAMVEELRETFDDIKRRKENG